MLSEHWAKHCQQLATQRGGGPTGTVSRSKQLDLMSMELRPVTLADFMAVLATMQPSKSKAHEYDLVGADVLWSRGLVLCEG